MGEIGAGERTGATVITISLASPIIYFESDLSLFFFFLLGDGRLRHQLEVSEACNWFSGLISLVSFFFFAQSVKRT